MRIRAARNAGVISLDEAVRMNERRGTIIRQCNTRAQPDWTARQLLPRAARIQRHPARSDSGHAKQALNSPFKD
eukprot:2807222-Alexandrium_andersonii.AAC.1